jgi:hypothetical protein
MAEKRYVGSLKTDVFGIAADESHIARLAFGVDKTVAADDDGVHAAISGKITEQTVETEIANPPCARNVVVTPGGTTADVAAGDVVVYGTNIAGEDISETFTFAANATAAITGSKAFKTVKKITVAAQDGTGCTFKIGFGVKFGLPFKFTEKPLTFASVDGTRETTDPTLAISDSAVESNTISLNTAPAGKKTDVYIVL